MHYAIIADVHANLEALDAALKDIYKRKIEAILFLGDAVGYGPNPNECIETLKKETMAFIAGNHDRAAVGLTDITYFNPYARSAIEWTEEVLSDENKTFLKNLPLYKSLKIANETFVARWNTKDNKENPPLPPFVKGGQGGFLDIFMVHATPREPEQWHYLINMIDAHKNFHFFTERICFIGHSHQPAIIEQSPDGNIVVYRDKANFTEGNRYIINVGSVGQPRDGDPDAAYALFDKDSVEIKRVSYDIVSTQKKMREVNLPSFLIERLARGR